MPKMNVVVRILYLYLFAMFGLIFIAMGSVQLIDMGLRAVVFRRQLLRLEPILKVRRKPSPA